MQRVYTGLPVFLAVAIKGHVNHLIDEYVFNRILGIKY